MARAHRLAQGPSIAYRYMKENLNRAVTGELGECMDLEVTHHVRTALTDDHREVKVRSAWGQQGPITLRIDLTGTVGSGNITARPPRRTFPQWLRRMRQHLADK